MHQPKFLRRFLMAVWLLAAGAAQAQLDYALYGVADFSFGRFEPSGALPHSRYNSNSLTASFVGGNAKYGLDGGWTPGITLESFVRFQDGRLGRRNTDPILSRNAFVSVASPYGLMRIGRLQTYLFDATARFNAFGNSISFSPALRHVFASGNLEGVQRDFYWNRAVSYSTPTIEGVTFSLMHSQLDKYETGGLTGGSLIVARGLLGVSLAAQRVKAHDGFSDPTDETTVQVGATYNFGVAKLFGQYTASQDVGLDVRSKTSSAGISLALGAGNLIAQVAYTTAKGPAVDRKHTSTSLGYVYPYDSTIDFYVLGMDDRVIAQTRGVSAAFGVRWRY